MTISVIEFDYHAEVLRNLCLVVAGSSHKLQVFTTTKIWSQVDLNSEANISVVTLDANKVVREEFPQHLSSVNSSDLIIFNSIASNYGFFSELDFQPPVFVRIHNVNTFFSTSPKMDFGSGLSDWLYNLEFFLERVVRRREYKYRRSFLSKVDGYLFPNQVLHNSYKNIRSSDKITNVLRQTISEKIERISNEMIISVPGSVEVKRRDYETLIEAIEIISHKITRKVTLVLLGAADKAPGITDRFKNLEGEFLQIISFTAFVPEDIYSDYLKKSSFIINPVRLSTRYQVYVERYGLTKISGAESDSIRYRLPIISPEGYRTEIDDEDFSKNYRNAEQLADQVITWIEKTPVPADDIFKNYGKEEILNKLENLI